MSPNYSVKNCIIDCLMTLKTGPPNHTFTVINELDLRSLKQHLN